MITRATWLSAPGDIYACTSGYKWYATWLASSTHIVLPTPCCVSHGTGFRILHRVCGQTHSSAMSGYFFVDLFKAFLLGVVCTLTVLYTLGQDGSGLLPTGGQDSLVTSIRRGMSGKGKTFFVDAVNPEAMTQEEAEKYYREQGNHTKEAKQYSRGACFDMSWWASFKACAPGYCRNLRHGRCEYGC